MIKLIYYFNDIYVDMCSYYGTRPGSHISCPELRWDFYVDDCEDELREYFGDDKSTWNEKDPDFIEFLKECYYDEAHDECRKECGC